MLKHIFYRIRIKSKFKCRLYCTHNTAKCHTANGIRTRIQQHSPQFAQRCAARKHIVNQQYPAAANTVRPHDGKHAADIFLSLVRGHVPHVRTVPAANTVHVQTHIHRPRNRPGQQGCLIIRSVYQTWARQRHRHYNITIHCHVAQRPNHCTRHKTCILYPAAVFKRQHYRPRRIVIYARTAQPPQAACAGRTRRTMQQAPGRRTARQWISTNLTFWISYPVKA